MLKTGLVYRVISPSGRCYIGLTTTGLACRKRKHLRKAAKTTENTPFLNALRKYGPDLQWEILISGVPLASLGAVERKAIELYRGIEDGYNVRVGGVGGGGLSGNPESRARQIAAIAASGKSRAGKGTRGPTPDSVKALIAKNNAWYWTPERRAAVSEGVRLLRAQRFWGRRTIDV